MIAALLWVLIYGALLLGIYLVISAAFKRPFGTYIKAIIAVAIMVVVCWVVLLVQIPAVVYSVLYPGVHEEGSALGIVLATILWLTLLVVAYPCSFYLYLAVDALSSREFAAMRHRQIGERSAHAQLLINPRPSTHDKRRENGAHQAQKFFQWRQKALERRRERAATWWWLVAIFVGFLLAFAWPYAPLAVEFDGNVR